MANLVFAPAADANAQDEHGRTEPVEFNIPGR
jgi:hypothetical protein